MLRQYRVVQVSVPSDDHKCGQINFVESRNYLMSCKIHHGTGASTASSILTPPGLRSERNQVWELCLQNIYYLVNLAAGKDRFIDAGTVHGRDFAKCHPRACGIHSM
jgi:hypothetical protein